jgi:hypothetical protein
MSIDRRSWNEEIDVEKTQALSGHFANNAQYKSEGEFIAIGNFARLLKADSVDAERVYLSLNEDGLLIRFSGSGEESTVNYADGLTFRKDGSILLPVRKGIATGEGAIGYEKHSIRLFVNRHGDLVTIQSGGGAGLYGPFPIGLVARHVAIFSAVDAPATPARR